MKADVFRQKITSGEINIEGGKISTGLKKKGLYGKEDTLQVKVADYLRENYPDVLWTHVANERKASPALGGKLKNMGVLSGVSDLIIFQPNGKFNGLAIELKIKPNKPSTNQLIFLENIRKCGWQGEITYTFEETIKIIDEYLHSK